MFAELERGDQLRELERTVNPRQSGYYVVTIDGGGKRLARYYAEYDMWSRDGYQFRSGGVDTWEPFDSRKWLGRNGAPLNMRSCAFLEGTEPVTLDVKTRPMWRRLSPGIYTEIERGGRMKTAPVHPRRARRVDPVDDFDDLRRRNWLQRQIEFIRNNNPSLKPGRAAKEKPRPKPKGTRPSHAAAAIAAMGIESAEHAIKAIELCNSFLGEVADWSAE